MSWTVDETNQFMALLGKYPAEKSQTNRWRKIANELETKSAKQVASKAQKEFVKMRRIRKRIPGSQDPGKSLPTRADEPDPTLVERSKVQGQRLAQLIAEKRTAEEMLARLECTTISKRITCCVCEFTMDTDVKYNCLYCPIETCEPCYLHITSDPQLKHFHGEAGDLKGTCLFRLEQNTPRNSHYSAEVSEHLIID